MSTSTARRRPLAALVALLAGLLLAAGLGAAPAHAAGVSVGTHNIHVGQGQVTPIAGVIGWQEVENAAGKQKLAALAGYQSFMPYPGNPDHPANSIPISWDAGNFRLVGTGQSRQTHEGESGVTPARFVNWVKLERTSDGAQFAFVNTHYINGAWNGKFPERQGRWNTHDAVVTEVVTQLRGQGLPVVLVGDFNRGAGTDKPGMNHLNTAGVAGEPIDQIHVSQGIGNGAAQQLGTFGSDHHAYKASVNF